MRTAVRTLSLVLAFVALGAAAASWAVPEDDLDAADAETVALNALDDVGVAGRVDDAPIRDEYERADGIPVDVWVVLVDVEDEPIEVQVHAQRGTLVYIDDRVGPDDLERLLTDGEFEALGDFRDDPPRRRKLLRNGVGTVSALLVFATGFTIARRSDRLWEDEDA